MPFALSLETVEIVLDALARLKAAESNDMQLGPGSQRRVNAVERAEKELRQQMPDTPVDQREQPR